MIVRLSYAVYSWYEEYDGFAAIRNLKGLPRRKRVCCVACLVKIDDKDVVKLSTCETHCKMMVQVSFDRQFVTEDTREVTYFGRALEHTSILRTARRPKNSVTDDPWFETRLAILLGK